MDYFKTIKINDFIYQFKDALGSLITLVIGSKKALVFDTGYGIGDLKSKVREYTSLPLIVVNSHGHMDHSCGNYQFDEVFISKDDYSLFENHNSKERRLLNINIAKSKGLIDDTFDVDAYLNVSLSNTKILNLKEIDLGNKKLEVVDIKGHTQGSIALYLKEDKIMLTSDAGCAFVWLFLSESTTVQTHIKSLENILKYDFSYFLVGHVPGLIEKEKLVERMNVCKNIDLNDSKKVEFENFKGFESYAYPKDDLYVAGKCGVIFDINKL